MAPANTSHDQEDPEDSLANMNPPSSLNTDDDDIIPLPPPQSENAHASASDSDSSSTAPSPTRKPTPSRSRAKKARKAAHRTQNPKPALRPAKDILSRIRHDASLDESDFVVGYVDRHAPAMLEMDVAAWKGGVADSTDEEWIPQHRIMYFRRKGEEAGRRVWDRAERLDRLFGSGVVVGGKGGKVEEGEEAGGVEVDVATGESEDGGNDHVIIEELS